MPRSVFATRVLPKLAPKKTHLPPVTFSENAPKLYNAKRRIRSSQPVQGRDAKAAVFALSSNPLDQRWRKYTSQDVTEFIDDMEAQGTKMLPDEQINLLTNPVKYFSRPQHVPPSLRVQMFFPTFTVAIQRYQKQGPYYTKFQVPLWFNKLDMKSYLKELYNVDIVHVRSWVTQPKLQRVQTAKTRGPLVRGRAVKNMIVQLVEPFSWPEKNSELDMEERFGRKRQTRLQELGQAEQILQADPLKRELDKKHRKLIAEQAKEVAEGKLKWSPTWQRFSAEAQASTNPSSESPVR